jgi:hypothetical protein
LDQNSRSGSTALSPSFSYFLLLSSVKLSKRELSKKKEIAKEAPVMLRSMRFAWAYVSTGLEMNVG